MRAAIESSGGERRRPREVTGRTVLFCAVAFFGVVASVNAVMIRFAITTFGGLETESSYKAGLGFAREIAASEAQDKRHWRVTAKFGPLTDGRIRVELTALDNVGLPLAGCEALVRLSHPTDRRLDRIVGMTAAGAGRFAGEAAVVPGQWDLVVDLIRGEERLFRSSERVILKEAGAS